MTELILALGAGLLSFLSPCVLPLIPGYISYVSGKSLNELLEEKKVNIIPIVLFTVVEPAPALWRTHCGPAQNAPPSTTWLHTALDERDCWAGPF